MKRIWATYRASREVLREWRAKRSLELFEQSRASLFQRNAAHELRRLLDLYGSDKGSLSIGDHPYPWSAHTYAEIYASLFDHCRAGVADVLECGIGTNFEDSVSNMTSTGRPGASLRAWRDYFPKAEIVGLDIDERVMFQENRISTFCVDQGSEASLNALWDRLDPREFDFVVDDG